MRPIKKDEDGIRRFEANRIIRMLLDASSMDLNQIWNLHSNAMISEEEIQEFYQLIGYTLSGYMELFEFAELPEKEIYAK